MCITAEHKSISVILRNALTLFHFLQQQYSFKGVLFTNSPSLIRYATSLNVDVITSYKTNPYHLPLVNTLLLTISQRYSASYYGYMNSDILLNPKVFAGLDIITQAVKEQQIPSPVEVASRVVEMPVASLSTQFAKSLDFAPILRRYKKQLRYRSLTCSDVFIFSADWPFESIPPFVVGRRWIDYGFNAMAVKYHHPLIDVSITSHPSGIQFVS
ncbi:hypothetical protein BLSTO_02519 [Blastocystis sp. subtype 1]